MKDFNSLTPKGGAYTKSQTWITPQYIIDALGGYEVFDLDPCGYKHPTKGFITNTARRIYLLDNGENGLVMNWFGNVFLNFPYNNSKVWYEKMNQHGNGVVLAFARTDTKAFQQNVRSATGINFLAGRVAFIDSEGYTQANANVPSCLIAWGEDNYKRIQNLTGLCVRIDK